MIFRIYYFALISVFVLQVGPVLPTRTSYALLYFGVVLSCCSLLCSPQLLPHNLLPLLSRHVSFQLARLCKLIADPGWVTVQRCGFVLRAKKEFQGALRQAKELGGIFSPEAQAALDSVRAVADRIYKETRNLRKRGDKGYIARLSVAIRVYRLSTQMNSVREMARNVLLSGALVRARATSMPFGMMAPITIVGVLEDEPVAPNEPSAPGGSA